MENTPLFIWLGYRNRFERGEVMDVIIAYIVFGIFILMIFGGGTWAYRHEKENWNNGECDCGARAEWINFDSDSQGGRGYKCPVCKRCIWISYPIDRIKGVLK
jgi:hypothetical protein